MNNELYIKRCLQLAKNGLGTTRPNPSVGAVIVYNNRIIGEGFTSPYGQAHAEVNAINSVKNQEFLKHATIYVTLEPCAHYGKTPPCADLIITKKIPNVVIGCVDTNSLVAGQGIERLRNAGCNVTVGVLEEDCLEHHKRFFTVQNKKRPHIILKWAETSNGYIAPNTKEYQEPVWISNNYSQQLVHKWRSVEHAILVGTNTVIDDNPSLTVRSWFGNNPVRIVLDRKLRIADKYTVLDNKVTTIVLTEDKNVAPKNKENVVYEVVDFSNLAEEICAVLMKHKIQSVIVEGGRETLQTFIDANIWDEAAVFIGNNSFEEGTSSPKFRGNLLEEQIIDNNILRIYSND